MYSLLAGLITCTLLFLLAAMNLLKIVFLLRVLWSEKKARANIDSCDLAVNHSLEMSAGLFFFFFISNILLPKRQFLCLAINQLTACAYAGYRPYHTPFMWTHRALDGARVCTYNVVVWLHYSNIGDMHVLLSNQMTDCACIWAIFIVSKKLHHN